MKKTGIIVGVIIGAIIVFTSCYLPFDCESGKGEIVEQTLDLSGFEKIQLKNSGTVHLNKGKEQRVVVKGQQNLIDLLKRDVSDDTWKIEFTKCVRNMDKFEIFISLPSIREASVYGSGDILAGDEEFIGDELELNIYGSGDIRMNAIVKSVSSNIKGSGDIEVKGSAMKHDIDIAGSGEIRSTELKCQRVDIDIKGSGDVRVMASEQLDVDILGSGDVYYTGNPSRVDKDVKGSGKVRSID